jgi:DNA-nicking Smr family endonuclease
MMQYLWSWLALIIATLLNRFSKRKQSTDSNKQNEDLIHDRARDPVDKLYEERSKLNDIHRKLSKKSKKRSMLKDILRKKSQRIGKRIRELDETMAETEKNVTEDMGRDKFDHHGWHESKAEIDAPDHIKNQSFWSHITIDQNSNESLTVEQKRAIHDQARNTADIVYERLSNEKKKMMERIAEIDEEIAEANRKAAKTIFELTNSVKARGEDSFDFHGLQVLEAKLIARYFIMTKFTSTIKEIKIITGRGKHSPDGKGKLKDELQKYFIEELTLDCREDPTNDGRLLISKKSF